MPAAWRVAIRVDDDRYVHAEAPRGHGIGVVRERTLHLLVLSVEEPYRGRGVGTAILKALARWCVEAGVRRIEVDDMSACHRRPRNVYVRAGFVYRRDTGPEMYASPRAVLAR